MTTQTVTATLKARRARQEMTDRLFASLLCRRPARNRAALGPGVAAA